jgi:endonuclease G
MSPQEPDFNTGVWKDLEEAVRDLDEKKRILETYVICGPVFYFDKPVEFIGVNSGDEISVPVPNAFFKSVLAENNRGRLQMWSFIFPNKKADKPLEDYRVATTKVEQYAGIQLWGRLEGAKMNAERKKIRKMW